MEAAYSDYIDGNTIDDIVSAGENFVYSDIYPKLSGVLGRTALYEALAGQGDGVADDSILIYLNGETFVSHDRYGQVVLGWVDGMRGSNVHIFGYEEAARDYIDELRTAAKEDGILAEDTD